MRHRSIWASDGFAAAVLLAPALTLIGVFGVLPIGYAIYLSLFRFRFGRAEFTGLGNYERALGDADFWASLEVTAYFAVISVPLTIALSVVAAFGLFRIGRGRGFFRTCYFLPYITSMVAAATVWRVLLNPQMGVVNALLENAGVPMQSWLLEPRGVLHIVSGGQVPPTWGPSLALCCIVLFEIWHSSGFMIVVLLAGMSAIPRELDEAARIDGAGGWQALQHVTLPMLSPTLYFLGVIGTIGAFQAFNSFFALTGGVPDRATRNLTLYIYSAFYENQQTGYGAALGALLAVALAGLTIAQWRLLRGRVHREA